MHLRLPHHIRQHIEDLEEHAKNVARTGHASLSSACQGAADALARRDDITAEHWLEKADRELHALKSGT